jgi:hypothetical protein
MNGSVTSTPAFAHVGVAAGRTAFLPVLPVSSIADHAHAAEEAVGMRARKRPAAGVDPSVDGGYL